MITLFGNLPYHLWQLAPSPFDICKSDMSSTAEEPSAAKIQADPTAAQIQADPN